MIIENVSTLKLQKLNKQQYEKALENNTLDNSSVYLTPTEIKDYALKTDLNNKADLIDGKVPVEQLPDDIGGGLTEVSWEDIKDKPFYEMGFSYEWDGNTEGLESFNVTGAFNFYKVSSDVPTKEKLTGAITSAYFDGDLLEGTIGASQIADFIDTNNGNFAILFGGQLPIAFIVSVAGEDFAMGTSFEIPSAGLWFMSANEGEYTHYIKSVESLVKTLDKKFVPSEIGTWAGMADKPFGEIGFYMDYDISKATTIVTIPANEEAEMPELKYCKVADYIDDSIEGYLMGCVIDGEPFDMMIGDGDIPVYTSDTGSTYFIYALNIKTDNEVCSMEDIGISEFTVSESGLYLFDESCMGISGMFKYLKSPDYEIKQIDKKYLPDDIGGGVVSWNDLKDKPFGETGFQIEWDGTPTDESYDVTDTMGVILYKVSSEAKTIDELVGATCKYTTAFTGSTPEQKEFIINSSDVLTTDNKKCFVVFHGSLGICVSVPEDCVDTFMGITFDLSEGIWFVKATDYTSIYLGKSEIKQIDKKFIPDDIVASVSLIFDEFPTEGSQNPVKSMGIHSAISALEGKITSTFCYKGTVANYSDLPMDGNTVGDVWNITNADEFHGVEAGDNAAWDGNSWDILAGIVDLSEYYTKTEVDSIALNGVANLANYYTKMEIDDMIGDCDSILNSINTLVGGVNV